MLNAIGLVYSNLEKTVSFYKTLGINFEQFENSEHYEATIENGLRVMLDSEKMMKELNPGYVKPERSSIILCFKKDNPEQVNQLTETLTNNNYKVTKQPWDAFWGQRYACVLDPDGNQIDIFADLK